MPKSRIQLRVRTQRLRAQYRRLAARRGVTLSQLVESFLKKVSP